MARCRIRLAFQKANGKPVKARVAWIYERVSKREKERERGKRKTAKD